MRSLLRAKTAVVTRRLSQQARAQLLCLQAPNSIQAAPAVCASRAAFEVGRRIARSDRSFDSADMVAVRSSVVSDDGKCCKRLDLSSTLLKLGAGLQLRAHSQLARWAQTSRMDSQTSLVTIRPALHAKHQRCEIANATGKGFGMLKWSVSRVHAHNSSTALLLILSSS